MKNNQTYTIKQVTDITGLTKRTLHYYDEIGLLSPNKDENNQYRMYTQEDIIQLQKIMFLKALKLPLENIQNVLHVDEATLRQTLTHHAEALETQIQQLLQLQNNLSAFLNGTSFTELDIFDKPIYDQYETEAAINYGDSDAYQSYVQRKNTGKALSYDETIQALADVFETFNQAENNGVPIAQTAHIVQRWKQVLLNQADYSDDILCNIAQLYVDDTRFANYFKPYNNPKLTQYIVDSVHTHLNAPQN